MQTKFIFVFFIIFTTLSSSSIHKSDGTLHRNYYFDSSSIIKSNVSKIEEYSWRECKYVTRLDDFSPIDMSDFYFQEMCDTLTYCFNTDGTFYQKNDCDYNSNMKYWKFNFDYSQVGVFYNEKCTDLESLFKIEEISDDTLKLFYITFEEPNEFIRGTIIYLHSIPKEEN